MPIRDSYTCTELPDLTDMAALEQVIGENEITDVIDVTNTSCKFNDDLQYTIEESLESISSKCNLITPIFSTPLDIREHRKQRVMSNRPILPGVVYPFLLSEYRFPCDVGTYIFWANYKCKDLVLDCQ